MTLLRLSSVTHAFNMEQRINKLPFSPVADGLAITAPSSANLAPPGYYMLFILDADGIPSVAKIVRIDAAPISIPAPPSGLAASVVSNTQINLTWIDSSTNEDGFKIERCQGAACTDFAQIAQVNAGVVVYSDAGLSAATLYRYRVRSFNVSGDSPYSEVVDATTASEPPPPAAAVTVWWPTEGAELSGLHQFKALVETMPLTNYKMYWQVDGDRLNAMTDSYVDAPHKEAYVDVTTWNWRGRGPYAINFVAQDLSDQTFAEKLVNIYVTQLPALPAPSNLIATAVSSSRINLTWKDNSSNESNFKIERCLGAGCSNFAQIAQVGSNVTSYANTGLAVGTTYTYRVRATNTSGNSDYSNVAAATTWAPPAAPSALVATPGPTTRQITLVWSDNSGNETGFKIERCSGATCTWFGNIAQVGANITTYTDLWRTPGTTYRYRVRSYNSVGNSAYSNIATATAP